MYNRGVVAALAGQAMALPLLPVKEQKKKKKNVRIIKHGYGDIRPHGGQGWFIFCCPISRQSTPAQVIYLPQMQFWT